MRKKHFFSIFSLFAILFSSVTLGTMYYTNNIAKEGNANNLNVKFSPGENITFSNLQNSTNLEVIGSDPAKFPDEYYQVDITITFPFYDKWSNSTTSLLKISNHDTQDKNVYFDAKGGSKYVQWIFLNFTQPETEKNTSIVWNTKGKINYYGDWIEKDNSESLVIPGRVGNKIFSIDFYFVALAFDNGVSQSQMESTTWSFNIYSLKTGNANGFLFTTMIIGLMAVIYIKKRKQQKQY